MMSGMRYESIKEKAPSFLAATGLRREEFEKLLPFFIVAYGEAYPLERRMDGGERRRRAGAGAKSKLGSMEDKLLFILNYHKTNPLQEQHGLLFGMSQGRVNIWVHKLFPVLQQALRLAGVSPCRDGSILNDHIASLGNNINGLELAIDGTERPRQRPKDSEKQRDCYSGKKKQHTHKNTIIGDK
jgi:Helix-turn-helix of DDE superfamily endonuclease